MTNDKIREVKGFISYSHEDSSYFEKFKKLLENVIKSDKKAPFKITLWSDKQILTGHDWHKVIHDNLKSCDFTILLVSNDFFGSDYIEKHEFSKAKSQNKLLIPIELTQVIDKNQFEGLGKVQWFTYTKFAKGETLGSRFDNQANGKAWQSEYINTFYTDLVSFLKESIIVDSPPQLINNEQILKVKDFNHIRKLLEGSPRVLKTIGEDDLVVIASNTMKRSNIRHLLVFQDKILKGIVSKRDIVKLERDDKFRANNVVISSPEFSKLKVSKIMIKNVISCDIEDNVSKIINNFWEKQHIGNGRKVSIGTLGVKKSDEVVEILSYTDILSNWEQLLSDTEITTIKKFSAQNIMRQEQEVQRLEEDQILAFGYDLVTDDTDPRRAIPIVSTSNPKILKGMISDLRIFSVYNDLTQRQAIKNFMRVKDIDLTNYFNKDSTFEEMVEAFKLERDLTSLPVVEGEELVGIVSYTNLIEQIAKQFKNRAK
jgi:CBS domain-containing protein